MEDRYIPSVNAGMRRGTANTGRTSNSGNTSNMSNISNSGNAMTPPSMSHNPAAPNTGAMPNMTSNMNNTTMPNLNAPSNTGMMPGMTAKPNMGTMPEMMAKPNTGLMPEMMAKPNMGAMPEMMNKPNMAAMPEMMHKPNMGAMPEMMNKPNMAAMPEMMAKPNMGAMPNMTVKSNTESDMTGCGYKNGELPSCAPLSVGFVPFQQTNSPKYGNDEALTRGTLFPGLDLPFMNIANKTNPYAGTPLGELMALGFVIEEINLYLDTHPKDKDALDMLKSLNKLMQEGREKYVKMFGPQMITDITTGDEYTWLNNPWPWEFTDKGAAK